MDNTTSVTEITKYSKKASFSGNLAKIEVRFQNHHPAHFKKYSRVWRSESSRQRTRHSCLV